MKKIFTFLMAAIVISAASCKKETVVSPATTILLSSNTWTYDAASNSYYTDIAVSQLDSYYQNNGAVFLYLQDDASTWEQLPDVFDGVTFRFTYTTGHVYIDSQYADGSVSTPPTAPLKLKLVLFK